MGTERDIDVMASEAVRSSEREVFAELFGQDDPADTATPGDRSLEETGDGLEGQHDDVEDEDEPSSAQEQEPEPEAVDARAQQASPPRVKTLEERSLHSALTEERHKKKAADAEFANYRSESERRLATLEATIRQLQSQPRQPEPKPEPVKEDIPDRWLEPEAYEQWREARLVERFEKREQDRENRVMAHSFREATTRHGDVFQRAYSEINGLNPDDPQARRVYDYIRTAPNPGEALMQVYRASEARRTIGADPAAFQQRVVTEQRDALMKDPDFRRQVLEAARAEAQQPGAPQPRTQLPPSLSSARGRSMNRANTGGVSDTELFTDLYAR